MNENSENNNSKEKASQEDLFNLIQDIQSKLNTNETKEEQEQTATSKIYNQNNNNINNINNNDDKNNSTNFLQNLNLSSLLGMFSKNNQETNNSIDPNMILKIQRVITSLNKEDPKKDLLISLKPFLRKSRQDKLGEYLNIITILDALSALNDKEGSDDNV